MGRELRIGNVPSDPVTSLGDCLHLGKNVPVVAAIGELRLDAGSMVKGPEHAPEEEIVI
jgi:hypothetical protein